MDLALFDLDETLICANSNSLWMRWLASQGYAPESLIAEEQRLMAQYHQGEIPLETYMNRTLAPLTGMATLTVSGWVRRFIQRDIVPRVYPAARERLAWHQQRGDTIMLVSAGGEHLLTPIAQRLGLHGALAVGVEIINDRYSGQPCSTLNGRAGKAPHLADWRSLQQEKRFQHTWAYSDSITDLPLLEQADHACVINPDIQLLQEARQRGWEVTHWEK
ncbi:hydrolase [Pantoea alhagi]|uniref:Hydrolase n=1 Tax=Pantoea alhagi TaxID=1891675 RepID=A0A1W6B0M2_9GAMM|nr:HAD family hydrolase [Pantoea alhagi]ARJ40614.1 hydrolase [Pantoea alhagi]